MKVTRLLAPAVFLAVLTIHVAAYAQAGAQKPPAMPPSPKPGPEHAVLKADVGTWDAMVEMAAEPGGKPMTSKGIEVNSIGCNGLCLISDFKGDFGGAPFHGHGTTTWDVVKKKYVGSWTDSMSQGLGVAEATWDPAAKKLNGTMEMPDQTGKVVKTRSVVEYPSSDKRVMTMYTQGPDGKDMQMMKITYARRK